MIFPEYPHFYRLWLNMQCLSAFLRWLLDLQSCSQLPSDIFHFITQSLYSVQSKPLQYCKRAPSIYEQAISTTDWSISYQISSLVLQFNKLKSKMYFTNLSSSFSKLKWDDILIVSHIRLGKLEPTPWTVPRNGLTIMKLLQRWNHRHQNLAMATIFTVTKW